MAQWATSNSSYHDSYGRKEYDRPYDSRDRDRYWDRDQEHPPRTRDWDMDRNPNAEYRSDSWGDHGGRDDYHIRDRTGMRGGQPPPDKDRDYSRSFDRDFDRHDYRHDRYSDRSMDWNGPGTLRGANGRKRDHEPDDKSFHRDTPTHNGSRSDDPDWKRRKIDQDEFYGYDNRPPGDYEFDENGDEVYQGPRRRQAPPSEPSQHVIFLGLDPEFTEADLHSYLTANGGIIDSVTIIRDRSTGRSRCFGFAQFANIQNASDFVLHHYPLVELPPPSSYITRAIPTAPTRNVKIDFSQSAQPQSDSNRRRHEAGSNNDGTRDIGSAPTSVVLLRLLDRNTTIDEICAALRAANGPGKVAAVGMKRIILIIDRASRVSLGFAFVEFEEVEDATALLGAALSPTLHPSGFFVSSRPVAISFALPYAFQLLPSKTPKEEWCIASSMAVGGSEDGWTRYWDETASVEEKTYEVTPREKRPSPEKPQTEHSGKGKDRKGKERQNGSIAEVIPIQAVPKPTVLQKSGAPLSLKLKTSKPVDNDGAAKPSADLGFSNDDSADTPIKEHSTEQGNPNPEAPAQAIPKAPPLVSSTKVLKDINKWKQAQEERSSADAGALSVSGAATAPSDSGGKTAAPTTAAAPTASKPSNGKSSSSVPPPDTLPGDPGFEYGDPIALTCLLCLRQLKSFHQLQRHNAESDLHKKNLKDFALRDIAKEKVAAARRQHLASPSYPKKKSATPPVTSETTGNAESATQQPKYRDRAQERRQALNQPELPLPTQSRKPRHAEGPPPPASTPAPPAPPAQDESNIGNKLLKKMGWSEGTGLGAENDGRVDPVKTAIYSAGAGLGAAKAREVTNFTSGSYGEAAKESARERFG